MTLDLAAVVTPQPHLAVEAFPDALLVWDETRSRLHHLDRTAAIVWEELDGLRQVGAVAEALALEFEAPTETVAADVLEVLGRLLAEGLLTRVR